MGERGPFGGRSGLVSGGLYHRIALTLSATEAYPSSTLDLTPCRYQTFCEFRSAYWVKSWPGLTCPDSPISRG